ncbi:MAG: hypothetical protein R3B52_00285 [Candidatus Paceibacterota bacterium]
MKLRLGRNIAIFALVLAWIFAGWPQVWGDLNFPPRPESVEAAVGDIGHWQDQTGSQTAGTSFAAYEYDTEIRNDGIYTQISSSTIELDEAGSYLILATTRGNDTSNGRNNIQSKVVQTSGSGSVFTTYMTGYSRDNSEDEYWSRAVGVIIGATANSRVEIQTRRDTDEATGGSVAGLSNLQIVRINPENWGIYNYGATSGAAGGTTPNTMDLTGTVVQSNSSAIEVNTSADTVTVKGDNKRYLIAWGISGDTGGSRTQRIGHLEYGGTDALSTRSYCYQRSSANEYCGIGSMDLIETSTSDIDIQVEVFRGPGVSADQGGADVDGSFDLDGNGQIVVLELPDNVEVFKSHDSTGLQNITSAVTLNAMRDVEFNDSESFTKASNSAMNVVNSTDVLAWANVWTARNNVSAGQRLTAYGSITVNGTQQTLGRHGAYTRGNQGSQDTFAGSFHPGAIYFVATDGHDIGLDMNPITGTEGGGTDRTQANTVGFFAINVATFATSSGNTAPIASAISIDSDASSITLTEGTTKNVVCAGTVTDADGYADIDSVKADLFRTSVGIGSGLDNNSHYQESGDSECVPSGGSGNSETYTCTIPVYYYADATDAGSPNASDTWTCTLTPSDGDGAGTTSSDTIEMASLLALEITESTIDFGTIDPGNDTGGSNSTTTITNTGNVDMDPLLSGTNMTSGANSISASNIEYAADAFTYGAGTSLSGLSAALDITLPQPTNDGNPTTTDTISWGLGVPPATAAGTYTGTNTITAGAGQ